MRSDGLFTPHSFHAVLHCTTVSEPSRHPDTQICRAFISLLRHLVWIALHWTGVRFRMARP